MLCRSPKAQGKRFTISCALGRSGLRSLSSLGLSQVALRSNLLGSSVCLDPHPREFGRNCSQLPYSLAFSWERASSEDQRSALATLYSDTDICERTEHFTPFVARVLDQTFLDHAFVDETPMFTSNSLPVLAMPMFQSTRSGVKLTASKSRALQTVSAQTVWKVSSLTAVSQAIPESNGIHSEDANLLLILLSFLSTPEKIPLDLLFRGATPRRRWTVQGEIAEVDAVVAGLNPEISSLLSNISRLEEAFFCLELSSTVSKFEQTYTLDEAIACRIREGLSPEHHSFWRHQALVIAYRAIPWKYIEPA
jgi:hypothetical protein